MQNVIQKDLAEIVARIQADAAALAGKTILISGGGGFLGTHFLGVFRELNRQVLAKPCRVISLDTYITGSRSSFIEDLDDKNIIRREGDVTKPLDIKEPIHFIIHAAGLASPVYYQKYPIETIEAAIFGAKNLLELARQQTGLESFLFFSSSEIYGDPDPKFVPTPETYKGHVSSIGPRSCYDESKRLTESLCMTYWRLYNLPIKIVRPFNVYGPGMRLDDYRVVPTFLGRALEGKALPVHDQGRQTRTFCYVTDALTGFLKVLLRGGNGEVYNVGTNAGEVDMKTLATIVSGLFDNTVAVELVKYPDTYPADEPNRRCPDITKIGALGYKPQIDLQTGLGRSLAWFREHMAAKKS